jgi:hypothetical protein
MNDVFASLNRQTKAIKLTLHDDKTNFMELCTNNKSCANLNVEYDDKTNEEVERTKFLGLQNDKNLNWKTCSIHCSYGNSPIPLMKYSTLHNRISS